jgi:ubiquinone/menaquinone biosynthesis C-methylase UbiE
MIPRAQGFLLRKATPPPASRRSRTSHRVPLPGWRLESPGSRPLGDSESALDCRVRDSFAADPARKPLGGAPSKPWLSKLETQLSHRYGLHGRFLAWFMARSDGKYDAFVQERKRELLSGLSGTLVEIGSGTGPNLRYLPGDLRVVAVEPNPFMHPHLLREARNRGRSVHLVRGDTEALPFPDESVEAVLSTLVLCSVAGLDKALGEIHRILKPGGRFIFMEHVGAPTGSWLRRVQRWVKPAWRAVGDGCEPDRETDRNLLGAGFREVRLERFDVPLPLVSPHIAGVAEK